jgi:hypothetical protein
MLGRGAAGYSNPGPLDFLPLDDSAAKTTIAELGWRNSTLGFVEPDALRPSVALDIRRLATKASMLCLGPAAALNRERRRGREV